MNAQIHIVHGMQIAVREESTYAEVPRQMVGLEQRCGRIRRPFWG
jgi:hypothetical protein